MGNLEDKIKKQIEANQHSDQLSEEEIIESAVDSKRIKTREEAKKTLNDMIKNGSLVKDPLTGEIKII